VAADGVTRCAAASDAGATGVLATSRSSRRGVGGLVASVVAGVVASTGTVVRSTPCSRAGAGAGAGVAAEGGTACDDAGAELRVPVDAARSGAFTVGLRSSGSTARVGAAAARGLACLGAAIGGSTFGSGASTVFDVTAAG
jgi:hypothetical protein